MFSTLHKIFIDTRSRWFELVDRSPLSRLGNMSLIAALASIAAKSVGFIKEIFVASVFGVSDALDVYFLAFVLIGFPLSILLNAIQTVMISSLAAARNNTERTGETYTSTLLVTLLAVGALLPVWLFALQALLPQLASGFSPEKLAWLESALVWMIPYYFLNGLNLLGYGVLQARQRFIQNGLLPVLTPLITIPIVYTYGGTHSWEILVIALTAGVLLEFVALNGMLARAGLVRRPDFRSSELARILQGSKVLLPGTLIMALGPIVEQSIAASLSSGAVATLGYGFRLPAALNGIVVTAIGITVLPYFSALLTDGKAGYCLHSLEKIGRWLLFLGLIFAAVLALMSETIVTLIYQRGVFDAAATARVYPIQQVYFLQLPFALLAMLGIRTLVALGRNGIVSLLAAMAVVIQIFLAWSLSTHFGTVGIAWGVTVASAFVAVTSFLLSRRFLEDRAL